MEMSEPVAWLFRGHFYDTDPSDWTVHEHPNVPVIPLYTNPQKYCPSENNEAYEKGFIDGMAKQRDSAVQRFVESGTPDSELAEHKRIIREQQAEIEALKLCKLTDEEIESAYWSLVGKQHEGKIASYLYNFARDILQKASEK